METKQIIIYLFVSIITSSTITGFGIWIVKKYFEHRFNLSSQKSGAKILRITTLFNLALDQTKIIHNHVSTLRKKTTFVFHKPEDQPKLYNNAKQLLQDLKLLFDQLESEFQKARLNIILLDEELFESYHNIKNSYGYIIRRVEDLIDVHKDIDSIEQLNKTMEAEIGCIEMFKSINHLFNRIESSLNKTIKNYG